jgi:hypothetical protein
MRNIYLGLILLIGVSSCTKWFHSMSTEKFIAETNNYKALTQLTGKRFIIDTTGLQRVELTFMINDISGSMKYKAKWKGMNYSFTKDSLKLSKEGTKWWGMRLLSKSESEIVLDTGGNEPLVLKRIRDSK